MNYELAKKLKEAGFLQKDNDWTDGLGGYIESESGVCYAPTLSEIIEACGNEFKGLMVDTEEVWHAVSIVKTEDNSNVSGIGGTLEEAVANLWLNLNKRDS